MAIYDKHGPLLSLAEVEYGIGVDDPIAVVNPDAGPGRGEYSDAYLKDWRDANVEDAWREQQAEWPGLSNRIGPQEAGDRWVQAGEALTAGESWDTGDDAATWTAERDDDEASI